MKDNDSKLKDNDLEKMEEEDILEEPSKSLDSGELMPEEESDSGVFNLAQMVANASITKASEVVEDTGPFETAVSDIPPAAVRAKRGYTLPVIVVVALLIVSATVAIVVAQKKKASAHEEAQKLKVALLQAQIEQFQGSTEPPAPEPVLEPVKEQKLRQEEVEIPPVASEQVESEEIEEIESEEAEEAEVETKQARKEEKKAGGRNRATKRAASSGVSKSQETKKETKKDTKKKTKRSGEDELDRLLGVGSSKKANKRGSSGTPGKPSRADIKAAMKQVAGRAKACSRFAKGTVQLKMTIAGKGHVKASRVVGSFANTQAGDCVKKVARSAKFQKFSDPSFTFIYPVILR